MEFLVSPPAVGLFCALLLACVSARPPPRSSAFLSDEFKYSTPFFAFPSELLVRHPPSTGMVGLTEQLPFLFSIFPPRIRNPPLTYKGICSLLFMLVLSPSVFRFASPTRQHFQGTETANFPSSFMIPCALSVSCDPPTPHRGSSPPPRVLVPGPSPVRFFVSRRCVQIVPRFPPASFAPYWGNFFTPQVRASTDSCPIGAPFFSFRMLSPPPPKLAFLGPSPSRRSAASTFYPPEKSPNAPP